MRGRRFSFWTAALVSAVIFAAIHPQGLMAIPALAAMGFGFSMLREWRGSLVAPMTAHAFHNGMLVLAMWVVLGG
jgi:membrane protease YdiL (CAAX protease family)